MGGGGDGSGTGASEYFFLQRIQMDFFLTKIQIENKKMGVGGVCVVVGVCAGVSDFFYYESR